MVDLNYSLGKAFVWKGFCVTKEHLKLNFPQGPGKAGGREYHEQDQNCKEAHFGGGKKKSLVVSGALPRLPLTLSCSAVPHVSSQLITVRLL